MGVLENNVDKKQEEMYKHQAGKGQDRMYLFNVVLDEENLFDYMGKAAVFQLSMQSIILLIQVTEKNPGNF